MAGRFKEALDVLLFGPKAPEIKFIEPTQVVSFKVVEVPAGRTPQKWTKEVRDSVATLNYHPGFLAILDRLALQKALVNSKLHGEYRKDLRENDWLQSGSFWLGYLQTLMDQATLVPRAPERDAMEEELEAFKQIDAQIERIGMEGNGDTIS